MPTCSRKLEWDAAHRVLRHESKCATLHGHRYIAWIEVFARDLDYADRVVDFGVIKELVGDWIDKHWDHATICHPEDEALIEFVEGQSYQHGQKLPHLMRHGEPTAENIARELYEVAGELLSARDERLKVVSVQIFETPNCASSYP